MKVVLSDFCKIYKSIQRMKNKGHDYAPLKNKLKQMFEYDYEIKDVTARAIATFSCCMPLCHTLRDDTCIAKSKIGYTKLAEIHRFHEKVLKNNDRHTTLYQIAKNNRRKISIKSKELENKFLNYEINNEEYTEKLMDYILSLEK